MEGKRVAIIGAGPSGLAAAKYAREVNLIPYLFEKADKVGGLWKTGTGIWPGMKCNLSKFSCTFSDFPWPQETETFVSAEKVMNFQLFFIFYD